MDESPNLIARHKIYDSDPDVQGSNRENTKLKQGSRHSQRVATCISKLNL